MKKWVAILLVSAVGSVCGASSSVDGEHAENVPITATVDAPILTKDSTLESFKEATSSMTEKEVLSIFFSVIIDISDSTFDQKKALQPLRQTAFDIWSAVHEGFEVKHPGVNVIFISRMISSSTRPSDTVLAQANKIFKMSERGDEIKPDTDHWENRDNLWTDYLTFLEYRCEVAKQILKNDYLTWPEKHLAHQILNVYAQGGTIWKSRAEEALKLYDPSPMAFKRAIAALQHKVDELYKRGDLRRM